MPASSTAMDDSDPRIQKFLNKLREAYTWKERYGPLSDELHGFVTELLRHSTKLQTQLIKEGKYDGADRVARDIEDMKNFWGKELLHQFNLRTFNREVMDMGPFLITAAQYFEPEEMYHDNEKLKIFSFAVAESTTGNTIFKYYLVSSQHERDCYILDLLTSKGHYQVRLYGVICPSYWSVREDVLYDISSRTGGVLGNKLIANLPTRV